MQSPYESVVLGDELVGYAREFVGRPEVIDNTLALDEIKSVGPGGNCLCTKYTRSRYREFWTSNLFDHARHDRWTAEGAATLRDRLQAKVLALRAAQRPFALSREQQEGMSAILDEVMAEPSSRI